MADWRMKGQYLKNCSCVPNCPCDTWGYPAPHKFCEGLVGMSVEEGHFEGVDLAGVKWVAVVHWDGPLHEGGGTMEVFIDESAGEEQRNALGQILSGNAGGPFFEIIKDIVDTVHGPHFVPIAWEFDKQSRRARVAVEGSFETESAPLIVPATDEETRVIIQIPEGFEYKEAEVAQAAVLTSEGQIKFDWKGTHSSLAEVDHTPEALVA
jgi:hypothetical protein